MFTNKSTALKLRQNIKGINEKVVTVGNKKSRFIYLDNAASTPPLISVLHELNDYLNWYAGVHRGTGYKSLISSLIYDDCHQIVANFVGADLDKDAIIFVKNTTEAINKLSYRLHLQASDIVIVTGMEHHSNDLPWRTKAQVKYAQVDGNGKLDLNNIDYLLNKYHNKAKLLAVCGASNVTGALNDVHMLAKMAHKHGCKILVDGAQLIPHQPFNMKNHSDPEHIDFLAFSSHKMFSPYGLGVLVGPREVFINGSPEYQGGGTVKLVGDNTIIWADLPGKEEAGSPNVVGAYALGKTIKYLEKLGMDKLADYEKELTDYALNKLKALNFVKVYGPHSRVGVISFNIKDLSHDLVGAILGFEAGIGLRTGCFCAQKYVRHLLGIRETDLKFKEGYDLSKLPGMVRISLAAYNTKEEIDYFIKWIKNIGENKYEFKSRYKLSSFRGATVPVNLVDQKYIENICKKYMK